MRSGTLRGAQQSREWLGDCSGDAEEAVVYRIRLIEPISADFAVLVGGAIRNLRSSLDQVAYQLAVQHSGPLTEDAERMTELPMHFRRAVRRLGDFEEQTDEAAPLEGLREAGFRTIRSGQPFAERLRRSANDRGRTPLADRRRLRGTTMSASSSTGCGMSKSTDAYLCWRATLAREGGR
jgi:hypothetical protein